MTTRWIRLAGGRLAVTWLLLANVSGVVVGAEAGAPRAESTTGGGTPAELTLADRLANPIHEGEVPGGAVVIVQGGEVRLHTFGATNSRNRAVSRDSVFRVASLAKVFTAATAATLIEEGRLDLDGDLRRERSWLGERAPGDTAVTLRQLLTHTSGFDDRVVGMFTADPSAVEPLGEYLARAMPSRTSEPGRWTRYSNHGAALAGLAIEEAAGMAFAEAVGERVLSPLGMESSSFAQPLPADLRARLARAFPCPEANCEPLPLDYRHTTPAGALVTTPADMARFMRAVLDPGGGALGPAAASLLATRAWRHREELSGMALALYEQEIAGRRALVHAGGSSGYKALLALVPEVRAGLFVVTSGGASTFGQQVLQVFAEIIGPSPEAAARPAPVPLSGDEAAAYTGDYLLARAARASYESFPARFLYQHRIWVDEDGFLKRLEGGEPRRYGRVGEDLFAAVDGDPAAMAFERDSSGAVVALHAGELFYGARFPATYERLPWWAAPGFVNELLSWVAGLPVLALLAWSVGGGLRRLGRRLRRHRGPTTAVPPRGPLAWSGLALILPTVVGILAFGFGFMARLNALARAAPATLALGLPEELARLLWLPWPLAGCAVVLAAITVAGWLGRGRPRLGDRLLLTIVSLCALLFTLAMRHFSMLPPAG